MQARGYELIINLGSFPDYFPDLLVCELIDDLRTNFKQIIPKGNNITLVSDNILAADDAEHYAKVTK